MGNFTLGIFNRSFPQVPALPSSCRTFYVNNMFILFSNASPFSHTLWSRFRAPDILFEVASTFGMIPLKWTPGAHRSNAKLLLKWAPKRLQSKALCPFHVSRWLLCHLSAQTAELRQHVKLCLSRGLGLLLDVPDNVSLPLGAGFQQWYNQKWVCLHYNNLILNIFWNIINKISTMTRSSTEYLLHAEHSASISLHITAS
jgi:hypothetical protein